MKRTASASNDLGWARAVIVAALVMTGCAERFPAFGGGPGDMTTDVKVVDSAGRITLPTDSFNSNAQDILSISGDLSDRMIVDCMAQHGFAYSASLRMRSFISRLDSRFGLISQADVERLGYTDPNRDRSAAATADAPAPESSAAFGLALFGPESERSESTHRLSTGETLTFFAPGGCAGASYEEIFGGAEERIEVLRSFARVEDFDNQSRGHRSAAGTYQDALSIWLVCMADHGETRFETPLSAAHYNWAEPRPSAEEIRVADLDLSCKATSRLVQVGAELEAGWQDSNLHMVQGDLERLEAVWERLRQLDVNAGRRKHG